MSGALSNALTSSVVQIIDSKPHRTTFDLQDLGIHNLLEHDASLTRLDLRDGDNVSFQPELFELMLADATHSHLDKSQEDSYTVQDIACTRARRTREHKESSATPIPLRLKLASLMEAAAAIACLSGGAKDISLAELKTLFTEERLPDWIVNPSTAKQQPRKLTKVGLFHMVWIVFKIWAKG